MITTLRCFLGQMSSPISNLLVKDICVAYFIKMPQMNLGHTIKCLVTFVGFPERQESTDEAP